MSKRYVKSRGDISIENSLALFRDMKQKLGVQLSNMIRHHWRVYQRKKAKKAASKKKKKKGKGKGTTAHSGPKRTNSIAPSVNASSKSLNKAIIVPKSRATSTYVSAPMTPLNIGKESPTDVSSYWDATPMGTPAAAMTMVVKSKDEKQVFATDNGN